MLRAALSLLVPPLCWSCGAPAREHDPLCAGCRGALRWLERSPVSAAGVPAWAPVAYEGPARHLVLALKLRGAVALAEPMSAQIAAGGPALPAGAVLVPVPAHPAALRRRGLAHTLALARALSRRARLPFADCLERPGGQSRQVGRGRSERLAGAAAVVVRAGAEAPRRAVLVDDVVTTGATLRACADALGAAGTEEVTARAYARTLPR